MHEDNIVYELEKRFPDKKVYKLSKVDNAFYQHIQKNASSSMLTIDEYLRKLGFEYRTENNGVSFDLETSKMLNSKYGVNLQELGEWVGLSRERVRLMLKNGMKKSRHISWRSNELDSEEITLINAAIDTEQFAIEQNGIALRIKRNNDSTDFCLVFVYVDKIKCVFDIPPLYKQRMLEKNFDLLDGSDFDIKKQLMTNTIDIDVSDVKDRIKYRSKRLGLTNDEYLQYLGLDGILRKDRENGVDYREVISKYIEYDNVVYIPSSSEDYFRLLNKARRSGFDLNEFVSHHGFIRADRKFDLEEKKKIEEYRSEFEELSRQGQVYLDVESKLYKKINSFVHKRNISVNSFLAHLGYERIYKGEKLGLELFSQNDTHLETTEILLQELNSMQTEVVIEKRFEDRVKRNRSLVEILKRLYGYKCQLCSSENSIPLIEKADGTYYVEVHHIEHLAKGKLYYGTESDEGNEGHNLDHYKNLVVVCPFHHKMLHYHHGGFEEFVQDGLYFRSKRGTIINIETNYHLGKP